MTPSPEQLFAALATAMREVNRAARSAAPSDLGPSQAFVLKRISESGPLSQQSIVEEMGVSRAAVSQLVAKLIESSLVTRRSAGLTLTSAGTARAKEIAPHREEFFDQIFRELTPDSRAELSVMLDSITTAAAGLLDSED